MEASKSNAIALLSVPHWVIFLRHLVGAAIALAAVHVAFYKGVSVSGSAALDWATKLAVIVGFALLVNGAWALFFTARSRGHFSRNLVRLIWVLALLVSLGEWSSVKWTANAAKQAADSANLQSPSASTTPRSERRVDELRRLYPRFAGLSDGEVLRVIASEYPEIPMETIASDLGLQIAPRK